MRTEPSWEAARRCPACGSALRQLRLIPYLPQYRCPRCGLVATPPACESDHAAGIRRHFRVKDPHAAVATSKSAIYVQALDRLEARIRRRPRSLLDLGCGCGYFLETAVARGWNAIGIDVVPEMIGAARKRVPAATLFAGELRSARLPADSLDAIVMWDVLDMVADPAAELAECLRILMPGGLIGVRLRNVAAQLWLFRCFTRLGWLWRRLGIKPPFTFHRFSFSRMAIDSLLVRTGFTAVACGNSPLTQGDPYAYGGFGSLTEFAKSGVATLSDVVSRVSGGRLLVSPSLLVWARKP